MAYKEAKEEFGKMIRWNEVADNAEQAEKTVYLGSVIQGLYVERKDGIGQNRSTIYVCKLQTGELVSFWGSKLLDGKFEKIPVNSEIRVTFTGFAKSKTPGGRDYATFKVEYDDAPKFKESATPGAAAPVGSNPPVDNSAGDGF